jgi:hypothetical protein
MMEHVADGSDDAELPMFSTLDARESKTLNANWLDPLVADNEDEHPHINIIPRTATRKVWSTESNAKIQGNQSKRKRAG